MRITGRFSLPYVRALPNLGFAIPISCSPSMKTEDADLFPDQFREAKLEGVDASYAGRSAGRPGTKSKVFDNGVQSRYDNG